MIRKLFANKAVRAAAVFIVLFFVLFGIVWGGNTRPASAETATYSDVMDDLGEDETFDKSEWPDNLTDYSLQIITIAESTNGELFLYVYQPYTGTDYDLTATSVNISTGINDNLYYQNYSLTLLNSSRVFYKYLVDGFEVKADALRYYDISAIYRNYYDDIDDGVAEGNTNTIGSYAIGVAKLWTACTVNGEVSYTCTDTTVVVIYPEQQYVGYVRYLDGYSPGFWWVVSYDCDRWYIAFDSDFEIGDLYEADVMYSYRTYETKYTWWGASSSTTYGEDVTNYVVTLSQDRIVQNELIGIWGQQHEWSEIESVETFIETNDLTDDTIETLSDKQWVLSFAVTEYIRDGTTEGVTWTRSGTEIYDVSILRLKFETEGTVYNLGVVSSMITPDPEADPDNNADSPDLGNWGTSFDWQIILAVLGLIILLVLIVLFWPIFSIIFKAIIWVICLPFRAIAALFRAIKKRRQKKANEKDNK